MTAPSTPPGSPWTIRDATLPDLDAILGIEEESFADPYPRGLLKVLYFLPGAYLVAESGGKVAGYAVGVIRHRRLGHVISVAVAGGMRKRGIGEGLMRALLERLIAEGAEAVQLEVRESNAAAIRLYERLNFRCKKRIKRYYADGESALVMRLDIKSPRK